MCVWWGSSGAGPQLWQSPGQTTGCSPCSRAQGSLSQQDLVTSKDRGKGKHSVEVPLSAGLRAHPQTHAQKTARKHTHGHPSTKHLAFWSTTTSSELTETWWRNRDMKERPGLDLHSYGVSLFQHESHSCVYSSLTWSVLLQKRKQFKKKKKKQTHTKCKFVRHKALMLHNGRNVEKREKNAVRMERKVLMSGLMLALRISVEQERICLRHLDSVSPSQLSPRYSGHEWLSVWIWELSVEGGK